LSKTAVRLNIAGEFSDPSNMGMTHHSGISIQFVLYKTTEADGIYEISLYFH
jgi:hypothetical protein